MSNNKLYFPLFYKHASLFSDLSNEEVGELIFAILTSEGGMSAQNPLSDKLNVIYKLVVDDARRLFDKKIANMCARAPSNPTCRKADPPRRYGNFDVNEAFERAIQRTYGDDDDEDEDDDLCK